jgi:hypothetical protein
MCWYVNKCTTRPDWERGIQFALFRVRAFPKGNALAFGRDRCVLAKVSVTDPALGTW